MRDIDGLVVGEDGTGDAGMAGQADFADLRSLGDAGKQRVGLFIMQEQGRALGVQHSGRFGHDPGQQRVQFQFRGDVGDDVQEFHFLGAHLAHALDELGAAQGRHRHLGDVHQQHLVIFVEGQAVQLVQALGDADDLVLHRADRHAQDGLGDVAGFLVDVGMEARVRIGVIDDQRLTGLEHRATDAVVAGKADFPAMDALRTARKQFVGVGVEQEKAAAVGSERAGGGFHQRVEDFVERFRSRHPAGDVEQYFIVAQLALKIRDLRPPSMRPQQIHAAMLS